MKKPYIDDDDHHTISTVGEHDIIDDGEDDIEVIMVTPMSLTLPVVGKCLVPVHENRCFRDKRVIVIAFVGLVILLAGITLPLVLRSLPNEIDPGPLQQDNSSNEGVNPEHDNIGSSAAATGSPTAPSTRTSQDVDMTAVDSPGSPSWEDDPSNPIINIPMETDDTNDVRDSPTETTNSTNSFLLPFEDVHIDWLTNAVVNGYDNIQDFQVDLTNAAKFLVNNVVMRQLDRYNNQASSGVSGGGGWGSVPIMNVPVAGLGWRGSDLNRDGSVFAGDVTYFETNNQEEGVDEADVMKADNNYIYAAYGDYILVWDKQGNQITQVAMPPTSYQDNGNDGLFMTPSSRFGFYQSKANIESLLLTEGYLVAAVSGYGSDLKRDRGNQTVLYDYLGTQIRTYQTSTLDSNQELTLVATKNVHGRYLDAQSVGSQVHISTVSGLDAYKLLIEPFQRYAYFKDMNDDEYITAVREQAITSYIPLFVKLLTEELAMGGLTNFTSMLKVNRWQRVGITSNDSDSQSLMDASIFGAGVVQSMVSITSLDVTAEPQRMESTQNATLATVTSVFFAPSQLIQMYGTESKLVLATRSWDWNATIQATEEVTHLVLLDLQSSGDSASSKFESIATVRGVILNPYSLDIVGDDLRVATTITKRWVLNRQRTSTDAGDADVQSTNEGYADSVAEESLTENYVTVMELDNGMKQRGIVKLGKKNEVIMAVHFFDTIAYAVTFDNSDPFYVLDLRQSVEVLGEYQINGFSNYLHAMNDNKTLLLAIGQNATDDGIESGLMITVFDARNPARPKPLVSHTIINQANSSAVNSVAQWDYKSFRYVKGKLIIPVSIYSHRQWDANFTVTEEPLLDNFEGFIVFNISTSSIDEHFRVSHATIGCNYCGYLSPRSFVFAGNVITVEGNSVSSTNLDSAENQWSFNVTIDGETAECCS